MSKNLAVRTPSRSTWITIAVLTGLIFLAKHFSKS